MFPERMRTWSPPIDTPVHCMKPWWYQQNTLRDYEMIGKMQRFIILVCTLAGDKLQVIGAEISAGAIQKEALEAMRTTFLRIHYNGTHKSASSH